MKTGFIGLGNMGAAMALNLARAGFALVVWNRTPDKMTALRAAEGRVEIATSAEDVFAQAPVVILMLAHSAALDAVLARTTPAFCAMVRGRTVINMGTTAPTYSAGLQADIVAAGGRYVEAPVSGSRVPAEQGRLIGMLAGDPQAISSLDPLLQPLCERTFYCGRVPDAMHMKLAVNLFLITMVAGLAEATHFAQHTRVDLSVLRSIIDAGPMASKVSSLKLAKMIANDYAVQASIADVLMNATLIFDAARAAGVASPLLDGSRDLLARADQLGHGAADMAAVILAL